MQILSTFSESHLTKKDILQNDSKAKKRKPWFQDPGFPALEGGTKMLKMMEKSRCVQCVSNRTGATSLESTQFTLKSDIKTIVRRFSLWTGCLMVS